jgi:homocysteine S-methyltransferase
LETFLKRMESTAGRIPVVAGICPLTSYRNAEFMNNEVPGISVPQAVMDRMKEVDTGERARAEGVRIAQETLLSIRDLVQGVQIAPPFGRYAMAVEVAEVLGSQAASKNT